MESKKINQLATEMTPEGSDLTIIGDPITGVSRKITLLQLSTTIGAGADLQGVTDNGSTTTNPIAIGGLTITGLATGVLKSNSGVIASVPFGAANGVATLGGDGKVPSNQLPSYVDDVVEVANFAALPAIGETGKIYITLDNNKVYRWTGSTYVEIAANNAVWGAITGTLSNQTDLQNALNAKVPYTGATANVNLGTYTLLAAQIKATSSAGLSINANSGTQIADLGAGGGANMTLFGGLIGTSASFSSSVTGNTIVKSGGTSSQFLKADGSVDSTSYGTGSVTSVGLSSATSGVTIGSTPITTSGTITLSIATASGSQNGLLSSTDWNTFNGKQNALTNPITGTGTTNYVPKFTASGTIGNSLIYDTGTRIAIGGTSATYGVLTVQSDSGQFCIQSNTTPDKQLQIGYDHTTNNSYLTSLQQGVAFTPLFLQPNGGTVGIGALIANSGDRALLSIKQTSTSYNNGIYLERGGERNGYFMYIGGASDSLTFRRNYFGTQSDVMSLTRDGNVLIGATTSDSYGGYSVMQVGGNTAGLFQTFDGTVKTAVVSNNTGAGLVGTRTNHALTFITNDSGKMDITAAGNINMNATVYNNTAVATTRILYIGSDYRIGGISSIRESKKNIQNISNVNWIYSLNPVTFNYRKKDEEEKYTEEIYDELVYGLIAEDTAPIADFLINYNAKEDGTKEMVGIEYMRLITPMLKAIQELKAEIEQLKNK